MKNYHEVFNECWKLFKYYLTFEGERNNEFYNSVITLSKQIHESTELELKPLAMDMIQAVFSQIDRIDRSQNYGNFNN